MQSQIGSPVPMRHGESIYAGITRWAARAERHLLEVMFWSGSLGSLAIAVIDTGHFLIATPMITLASIGGWGLAERDRRQHAGYGGSANSSKPRSSSWAASPPSLVPSPSSYGSWVRHRFCSNRPVQKVLHLRDMGHIAGSKPAVDSLP